MFFLLFVIELTDVERYINFISSPRKNKRSADFFKVDINCKNKTTCGICYKIDPFTLFQKLKIKNAKGCCMLNAKVSMEDIFITNNTVIKPKDVIF